MNYKSVFRTISAEGDLAKYRVVIFFDIKIPYMVITQSVLTDTPEGYSSNMKIRKQYKGKYLISVQIALKLNSFRLISNLLTEVLIHHSTLPNNK